MTTYGGMLTGSGSLIQTGGTLTLSGTNTYGGGTTISGGLLSFSNSSAVPTTGQIAIGANGVLAATPIYSSSAVTGWLNSGRLAGSPSGAIALTNGSVDSESISLAGSLSTLSLGAAWRPATFNGTLATAGSPTISAAVVEC